MIADARVVRALDMRGFWSDVGTPEDLKITRAWFKPKRKQFEGSRRVATVSSREIDTSGGWDGAELERAAVQAREIRARAGKPLPEPSALD